ncbi:MAG TPA: tetratricopeptide repeat protein, partial [Methylomirabilota bacterium]|nr:tetratricopeptide repeat protein [Methylomirabilota bacterium]
MRTSVLLLLLTFTLGAASPRFSILQMERLKKETRIAIMEGKTNVALAKADELINLDKEFPEFWYFRATLLERYSQYDKAISDAKEYLRLKKNAPDAHQYLGTLYFKNSQFTESVKEFREVTKLQPEHKAEHWQLGISLYYAGLAAEGRDQFELHQTVNTGDLENAAWHFLCVAAAESPEKA